MKMLITLLLSLCVLALPGMALAQETALYEDPAGRFSLPIPEGWTVTDLEGSAHFTNAAQTINVYALVVPASEVTAGIELALQQIEPGFEAAPLQSNAAPLPNGTTWHQQIYVVDADIIAAIGRVVGEETYVLIGRAPQAVFTAENNTVLQMLLGFTITADAPITISLPDYVNQDSFSEQEVVIEVGRWSLPGTLSLPNGDGPFPAAVLVHGSGPSDRDETTGPNKTLRDLAWGLASNGIAVLRYDKRSFVYGADSVDDIDQLTVQDEVIDDALAAVELLRAAENVDPARIFVIGHSLGAMVAPRIAQQDADLAGIVLLAGPSRSLITVSLEQFAYLETLPENQSDQAKATIAQYRADLEAADQIDASTDPQQRFFGAPTAYWLDLQKYNQVETAAQIPQPILVLQGERDYQVTMEDFAGWQAGLADKDNVTFGSYPALNHLLLPGEGPSVPAEYYQPGHVPGELIRDIVDWITAQS